MKERKLIEVIGPRCPFCRTLYKRVKEVVTEQGIDSDVEHVTQFKIVMKHFPFTPVFKFDDKVVHCAKWLTNKKKVYALILKEIT